MKIEWRWHQFNECTRNEIYDLLQLRSQVFVVEQNIICLDADGKDLNCWHLLGYQNHAPSSQKLVAYLRVLPPGMKYAEVAIGRVACPANVRGQGLGRALMQEGLKQIEQTYGAVPVRLSAQCYLQRFYESFGFKVLGSPYIEEGIEHVGMIRG